MKPVKLTMQAFGPYAGTQIVDFAELLDNNLFLIAGPTGSGKTTILDAMAYALYGETSGGGRSGEEMRSHHAELACATVVTFDFELGNRHYRVTRRPGQNRPRKRGEGTTWDNTSATLWDRSGEEEDGDGHVLADGNRSVTGQCKVLLGFSVEQFRQIVTLPQGRFREFLDADSATREAILEKLFQTQRYRKLQDRFKSLFSRSRADLAKNRTSRQAVLGTLGKESVEELETGIKELQAEEKDAVTCHEKLKAAATIARKALEQARAADKVLAEQDSAKRDKATLEKQKEAMVDRDATATQARKALALSDVRKVLERASRDLADKTQQAKEAQAAVVVVTATLKTARAELAARKGEEPRRRELAAQVALLNPLRKRIESIAAERRELVSLEKQQAARTGERVELAGQGTTLREAIAVNTARLEEASPAVAELAGQEAEVKMQFERIGQLRQYHAKCGELKKVAAAHSRLKDVVNGLEKQLQIEQYNYDRLTESWTAGQSAVLASGLAKDKPCPVCGSTEHPAPASGGDSVPSEKEMAAAKEELADSVGRLDKAREKLGKLKAGLAAQEAETKLLANQLGDEARAAVPVAEKVLSDLKKALAATHKMAAMVAELKPVIAADEKTLKDLELRLNTVTNALSSLEGSLSAMRTGLEKAEAELPEGIRSVGDLEKRLVSLGKEATALEQAYSKADEAVAAAETEHASQRAALAATQKNLVDAEREAKQAGEIFETRIGAAGFANREAYQQALLTEAEVTALEGEVKTYQQQLAAATDRARRADKAAKGLKRPELEKLEKVFNDAEAQNAEAVAELGKIEAKRKQFEDVGKQHAQLLDESAELEKKSGSLGRISEVVNGRNRRNVTLQRYVLSTMLDSVLCLASARLRKMSSHQYELRRDESERDGRKAGGLELAVFDEWTGNERSVRTLSGGESFLTALALANSLSEAVQSFAGGIRLDTVFVDEGFGSLDSEALDEALASLVEMQSEGRLIGIISHVSELRTRIPARLEVTATRKGSTARFVA